MAVKRAVSWAVWREGQEVGRGVSKGQVSKGQLFGCTGKSSGKQDGGAANETDLTSGLIRWLPGGL